GRPRRVAAAGGPDHHGVPGCRTTAAAGRVRRYHKHMDTATKLPPARERVEPLHDILKGLHPEPACALDHEGALQLLVATTLSAQCTDARVNTVTPALFARFKTAGDFAEANPTELQSLIKPTGFYKNKAKLIQQCCKALVERFGGEVPGTLEELVTLPG